MKKKGEKERKKEKEKEKIVLNSIKRTSGDNGNSEEVLPSYESRSIDSFQLCETIFFRHLSLSTIRHGSTPCNV